MNIIASIFKKIFGLFKWGAVQVNNGMDKLYDAQKRLQVVEAETLLALDKQEENAKKVHSSIFALKDELEKAKNDEKRFKTTCTVIKNRLVKEGKDWQSDDELLAAGQIAQEQAKFVQDLEKNVADMEAMGKRVDKMLSKLKANKLLVKTKARILASKINYYKNMSAIDENGNLDIDSVFSDIDSAVQTMEYDSKASAHVNSIVNGQNSAEAVASDADVLNYLDNL